SRRGAVAAAPGLEELVRLPCVRKRTDRLLWRPRRLTKMRAAGVCLHRRLPEGSGAAAYAIQSDEGDTRRAGETPLAHQLAPIPCGGVGPHAEGRTDSGGISCSVEGAAYLRPRARGQECAIGQVVEGRTPVAGELEHRTADRLSDHGPRYSGTG